MSAAATAPRRSKMINAVLASASAAARSAPRTVSASSRRVRAASKGIPSPVSSDTAVSRCRRADAGSAAARACRTAEIKAVIRDCLRWQRQASARRQTSETGRPRWRAWLQFGLPFNAVRRRTPRTNQERWSRLNRSEQLRPELLTRHTVQRGSTATPPDNRQLARPPTHRASWDDSQTPSGAASSGRRGTASLRSFTRGGWVAPWAPMREGSHQWLPEKPASMT